MLTFQIEEKKLNSIQWPGTLDFVPTCVLKQNYQVWNEYLVLHFFISTFKQISHLSLCTLELSVKLCPVRPELYPSFDASSPPGCCLQSHEILLNKGMKYWDSGLNGLCSRTFIITGHIAAAVTVWRRSGKEMTGQTQFNTKFAAKLSFMPSWSPVYLFFSCILKSHPLCDQTGGSGAIFSWLYG
jgi:hypothetical protein